MQDAYTGLCRCFSSVKCMPLDCEMSKSLASELLGYVRQNLPSVIHILSLHLISWGNFKFSLPTVMKAKSASHCVL